MKIKEILRGLLFSLIVMIVISIIDYFIKSWDGDFANGWLSCLAFILGAYTKTIKADEV